MNNVDLKKLSIISEGAFLLTSGVLADYNTMTAGWGQIGVLWQVPVFTAYVRYNRFTYEFTERYDLFTVSFFDQEKYADMLKFCGTKSGRDFNKAKETGLSPILLNGSVAFSEAHTIYVCKKLYTGEIAEEKFINKDNYSTFYSETNPSHRAYIGEIIAAYSN